MHIISIKMLRDFWQKHPEAEKVLREWHTVVEHTEFMDFNHVREFLTLPTMCRPIPSLMWAEITIA